MNLPDEIYIVVTEFDFLKKYEQFTRCPLAWETYLDEECSKSGAMEQAERLNGRYGKTKIGRLVFEPAEEINE